MSLLFDLGRCGLTALGLGRSWQRLVRDRYQNSGSLKAVPRGGARLFQVVGMARSGTTLLARRLGAHPQAECLMEPYLSWILHGRLETSDGGRKFREAPHRALAALCRGGARLVGFKETWRDREGDTHALVTEPFLKSNFAERAVEHTVAIVRDPRDIWGSVTSRSGKLGIRRPEVSTRFTDTWNGFGRWTLEAGVFTVRYEDLAARPEETLREVCGRLECDFHPAMVRSGEGREVAILEVRGDERALSGAPIDTSSVGRFAEKLSPEEIAFIAGQCSELMAGFGYAG
jgi:hypothetical protein